MPRVEFESLAMSSWAACPSQQWGEHGPPQPGDSLRLRSGDTPLPLNMNFQVAGAFARVSSAEILWSDCPVVGACPATSVSPFSTSGGGGGRAPGHGLAVCPEKPHSPWLFPWSKEGLEVSGSHSPLGQGVLSAFFIATVRPPFPAQGGHPQCRSVY